jgi:4-hydroxy-tetrahydrodipicolinate synthase
MGHITSTSSPWQGIFVIVGTPMSAALLARMCRELPRVRYLKEETLPEPDAISATIAATGDACDGVFGGHGGIYMIDEHKRGACSNMPACQSTDVHVAIYDKLATGDDAGARTLFNQLLPLINYERMYGVTLYKEVLVRRGVIASKTCRAPGKMLDAHGLAEVDAIMGCVEPLFRL